MHQSVNIPIKLDQSKQQSKQNDPTSPPQQTKRPSVMERLRALEAEMSVEAAGLQLPEDPELTEKLSKFLAAQHPDADLQITETPGMVGLEVDKLMDLQRKLMAKISSNKLAEEAEKQQEEHPPEEEEWARRGPPDVQRSEMVEEAFPMDEGAQMISKKRTHLVTMSQSKAQGLDELPITGGPAPGTKSSHAIKLTSTGPTPQKEDASLSLSLSTSTSSAGSVKEKVARFESMKSKEEAKEAAKKRFGWKGPSMISPPSKKCEEEQREEEEEARKAPSRIPTRSPLPSPTREKDIKSENVATLTMLEKQPEMKEEDVIVEEKSSIMKETDLIISEKEKGEEKQLEKNGKIIDMAPREMMMMAQSEESQPQTTIEHMEIIEVGPEVIISHQESHPEMEPVSFEHIEKLDAAPIMGIAQIENQQKQHLSEPIIINIEPPSAVHDLSPPESSTKEDETKGFETEEKPNESERRFEKKEMKIEKDLQKKEDEVKSEQSGQYMPFGAETIVTNEQHEQEEKYSGNAKMELELKIVEQQIESELEPKIVEKQIESELEPKIVEQQIQLELEPKIIEQQIESELEPKIEEGIESEIIEIMEEEPMKLRRISMDNDRPEIEEEISEKGPEILKEQEAIAEQLEREGRPELFVTTGLNVQTVEPTQNIEIKVVEPDDDEEEKEGKIESEEKQLEERIEEQNLEEIPQEKQIEVYEMKPEKREIHSAIWLDNVPIERCAYEEDELAEKKALLWPEEEIGEEKLENILSIVPIMGGIPWFIESEDDKSEVIQSKEEEMAELNEMRFEDGLEKEEMYRNTSDLKSQFEEEIIEETRVEVTSGSGNDQKLTEGEKEMIDLSAVPGIQLEQIAPSQSQPQKFPPPLSPLHSEESIGGLETEDDERSSTHTVIHKPEMLLEEVRTRSLYRDGGSSSTDAPEEAFVVYEQRAMDEQTPTSPVMNAERWKSLDEKSSTIGSPAAISPSPINIEITRESVEKEDADKNIMEKEESEFIEEVKPDGLMEQKGMENFENEEKNQPEIVGNVEIEPQVEKIEETLLIEEYVRPIHESESTSVTQREEEYPGVVQRQIDVKIYTEMEGNGKEEDLLVESEPVEIDAKETMDIHFDEEGHTPKKHQEMDEDELEKEEGNKNEEFELVETQEFVTMEGKPQSESFECGMGEFESNEQIGNKEEILVEVEEEQEKEERIGGEIFSESGEENPRFSAIVDLPAQEEQKKVDEMEEKSKVQKSDDPDYKNKEQAEEFDEKRLKNLDEIRNKEETTALGLVTARQAELLVEDVINRVLEEGVLPSPDDDENEEGEENSGEEILMDEEGGISAAEASPEPVSDDWELVEGEQGKEKQQYSMEELSPEMAQQESFYQSEMIKSSISIEKEESFEEKDGMNDEEEEEEEDAELVKLQLGVNDDKEGDEKFEKEEDDDIVPEQPESPQTALSTSSEPIAGLSKSFLSLSTPVHRPKSPIPPPAAPTPPQLKDIEKVKKSSTSIDQTKKDEMGESLILMDEGFTKMPENVLDLDEESNEELHRPIAQQRIQSPPDELEKIHEQMLASGNLAAEDEENILHQQEGDSASSGGGGTNSIGSSPAKKRRSTSSSVHAGNGGGESAEGSLLEFERIEQEIIGQDDGEMVMKVDERKEEMQTHLNATAAAITATRGSAESISGSISSLTEFEQLEKEVREAVGIGDEIMILSDIREESEEGVLEEGKLEDEDDDELERMSTREDEEEEEKEEMGMKGGEIEGKKEELSVEHAAETIMLSSADSLEVEKPFSTQFIQQEGQKMETSIDSLELDNVLEKSGEIEEEEMDSLEEEQQEINVKGGGNEQQQESKTIVKVHSLNIPTRGNGNGSPSAPEEEDDAEKTTFETIRINPMDGKEERLIRTAITRARDPIHSRVRFVGTEDEQRVQAILEGRGDTAELETTDEEGNVTRVRTIVEREIVQ